MVYVAKVSISELIFDVMSYIQSKKYTKYMNEDATNDRLNKLRVLESKYLKTDSSDEALNIYKKESLKKIDKSTDVIIQVEDEDKNLCSVCMDRERDIALIPCGHTILCEPCSSRLKNYFWILKPQCPICRQTIKSRLKLYF
jgi:hypothetical protein